MPTNREFRCGSKRPFLGYYVTSPTTVCNLSEKKQIFALTSISEIVKDTAFVCRKIGDAPEQQEVEGMRTYSTKPHDIEKKWIVINAEGVVLGRLASIVAARLRGKHKPIFAPHLDTGDNVIIVNADKVQLTGTKRNDKTYYWHTGYPGGIRSRTARQILEGRHPERIVVKAVQRMLPKNKLSRKLMTNLRVYCGPSHPHQAQNPIRLDVASFNPKNTRRAQV